MASLTSSRRRITRVAATIGICLFCTAATAVLDNAQEVASDEMTELAPTAKQELDSRQRSCVSNDQLDGIVFTWCIDKPLTSDRAKVLYFLHGSGGNERTLLDSTVYSALQQRWKAQNVPPPVIIAVTFGIRWLLTDLPSNYVTGRPLLFDFFTQRLMPYLESKLTTSNVARIAEANTGAAITRRFLMGVSMGSYNSALLVERKPALFEKAVLGCPGFFTTINPFSSAEERTQYETRTGAGPAWVDAGLEILGKDELGLDLAAWQRNDPLEHVTSLTPASPAIFVWYNDADRYGFQEGAAEFSNSAALLGVRVREPLHNAGRHCVIDTAMEDAIAAFLQ